MKAEKKFIADMQTIGNNIAEAREALLEVKEMIIGSSPDIQAIHLRTVTIGRCFYNIEIAVEGLVKYLEGLQKEIRKFVEQGEKRTRASWQE